MTGRKTLGEVRAELEAALGLGPAGDSEVAESLRRFLAAGPSGQRTPNQTPQPTGAAISDTQVSKSIDTTPTAEP